MLIKMRNNLNFCIPIIALFTNYNFKAVNFIFKFYLKCNNFFFALENQCFANFRLNNILNILHFPFFVNLFSINLILLPTSGNFVKFRFVLLNTSI